MVGVWPIMTLTCLLLMVEQFYTWLIKTLQLSTEKMLLIKMGAEFTVLTNCSMLLKETNHLFMRMFIWKEGSLKSTHKMVRWSSNMTYLKWSKTKKALNTMKSSMESHTIRTQESLFLQERTGPTFTSSL